MPRFVFEQFCLDTERKELLRGGAPVHLTPRAFQLLELLIRERPRAVSKRELLEQVWGGNIVEESNLKTLVLEIRSAMEERGGSPGVIRTVYGFGYAFDGTADESGASEAPPGLLLVRWERRELTLAEGSHLIGRRADCTVTIDHPSVSRVHARLQVSRAGTTMEDLHSKNGTFVGGARISATTELLPRCRIRVGEVDVELLRLDEGSDSTLTVG
ncbi:MAG TPA: winged helix-turn-helix domain-containing protein [Thermoanaerobaculia bacterium]|nr:winged helix-turn-helix domain-containing protein [Thermoanaerobaculia bacterium]